MIIALTFFLGLKHFTRSKSSLAISSNPIDAFADAFADAFGPRSYNS
jgi:hypothetical protein